MAELFNTDRTSILKHIKNIYVSGELEENSTCAKIAQVHQEGKRRVKRDVFHYNLDTIISVGYRVNSKRGTQFRQWATQRLKDYLVKGYAINQLRLDQLRQTVQLIQQGSQLDSLNLKQAKGLLRGNFLLSERRRGFFFSMPLALDILRSLLRRDDKERA